MALELLWNLIISWKQNIEEYLGYKNYNQGLIWFICNEHFTNNVKFTVQKSVPDLKQFSNNKTIEQNILVITN